MVGSIAVTVVVGTPHGRFAPSTVSPSTTECIGYADGKICRVVDEPVKKQPEGLPPPVSRVPSQSPAAS